MPRAPLSTDSSKVYVGMLIVTCAFVVLLLMSYVPALTLR